MAEIWFIRHGESLSNAGHVVENTATVPLTLLGQQQALEVSKVFTTAPDLIVVTPYLRTQLTAIPTQERFPQVRQEIWPLQEFACLSFANYANTSSKQRAPLVKAYWDRQDPDHIDGEGAESFNMMVDRIQNSLARLQSRPEKFIAIFTHGRVMHTLRFLLTHSHLTSKELMREISAYVRHSEIENCSIIRATANEADVILHKEDYDHFLAGFKKQQAA